MPAVNKNKKSNNKLKDSGTRLHAQVTNIFLILYNIFFFILKKNSTCFTLFSLFFHTEAELRDFLAFFYLSNPSGPLIIRLKMLYRIIRFREDT